MSYDPRTIAFLAEVLYEPIELASDTVQGIHNALYQRPEISYQYFQVAQDGIHLQNLPQSPGSVSTATFLPDPSAEFGHDPHNFALHPVKPDRLYQQNHCGIYRLDRPGTKWERIGNNMPKAVGDIGFPLVLHPRDPETLWVFPMDGTDVWPRTSPAGKPAAYVSRNGGKTWKRQDKGFPKADAWWTVKRQAFAADAQKPLGLAIITSTASSNRLTAS